MDGSIELPVWLVVVAGTVLVVALASTFLLARSRRRSARRLHAAVVRLEERPSLEGKGGLEPLITLLEEGIDRVIVSRGDVAQSQERLSQALQAVPLGVVVCDEEGEVRWRNAEADRIASSRHGDAVLERTVREAIAEVLGAEEERRRTVELFGPPRRVIELRAIPLEAGWRTGGAVAVIEDVSERRRVDAMRRDFVANISHELKTPVGALVLLGETIAAEEDHEVMSRLASRMQRESARVARIIDDLLALSRIEAEAVPSRERVKVHLVVAEAVDRVRHLAENKRIAVKSEEPDRSLALVCDRRQVVSAVFNLLENAVKYSSREQEVRVSAGRHGDAVFISVADDGIGIPTPDLDRIFERFYRVDRGRSRETGGTGLGLAIVRHVVNNHDGEVVVESREGEGSVFTLRLPGATDAEITDRSPGGHSVLR